MKPAQFITAAIAASLLPLIASATALEVTIENIEKAEGTIRLGVFDASGYDSGDAVSGAEITVDGNTVTATIDGIAPGEYGIKLFHDVDNDGEMATNPFGMPTEPFAFSNNARGRFGPAKWDDAKFTVGEDGASHTITMK